MKMSKEGVTWREITSVFLTVPTCYMKIMKNTCIKFKLYSKQVFQNCMRRKVSDRTVLIIKFPYLVTLYGHLISGPPVFTEVPIYYSPHTAVRSCRLVVCTVH